MASSTTKKVHLHQRLLRDVDELCRKPYPNIELQIRDDALTEFCLILSPPGWDKMHLTIYDLKDYPLRPPTIQMNSKVHHPNVFGSYICASILNTTEGYTPAYTLKSIAIQLLSFFGSENLDQSYGEETVNLGNYRKMTREHAHLRDYHSEEGNFRCGKCKFGQNRQAKPQRIIPGANYVVATKSPCTRRARNTPNLQSRTATDIALCADGAPRSRGYQACAKDTSNTAMHMDRLPNEILLVVIRNLEDFEDLTSFARAWRRASRIIIQFDVIRQRELQCFVLKKTYEEVNLGIGVHGNTREVSSEFDMLSQQAFEDLVVRHSVHHVPFHLWLPLPIARPHWRRVRSEVDQTLQKMKRLPCIKYPSPTNAQILYQFMNDIVVRLNKAAMDHRGSNTPKSTLRHASDKAIEAYFHLFHLLVCLATEDESVVHSANRLLVGFQAGKRSKTDVPNLGHLLIALLISDVKATPELMKAIVTEAITRNVVWALKENPQLAYREPDEVSAYRLHKTFRASRTSYRLLMFSELFRRTARPDNKSLADVREELFHRHGGPPPGAASQVAAQVRRLHEVDNFPHFMREMGFTAIPTAANFTAFLRRTLDDSVRVGYSREPLTQAYALALRLPYDTGVRIRPELEAIFSDWTRRDGSLAVPRVPSSGINFFPETPTKDKIYGRHNVNRGGRGRR